MFNSIFTSSITFSTLSITLIVSIILGIIIALTHKYTSKFNKNFLITITLLPMLVASVMLMVNGNLGTSVAVMGAFSLIRFRSIPGTSKEILTVFFAMAVGLSLGMGQIYFATIITLFGSIIIFILNNIKLFEKNNFIKTLKVLIPENLDYIDIFDDIFLEYLDNYSLEKTKTTNMGSMFELTYTVTLKDNNKEKEFIDKIRSRNSNLKVSLSRECDSIDL